MHIKPSTALRNDYGGISRIAHETGEPIYITKNGEGDLVLMSIEAFEKREKSIEHRALILEAEFARRTEDIGFSLEETQQIVKG